jgi:Kdo2-lipid IVA lauroyltransferase/acyltransferase
VGTFKKVKNDIIYYFIRAIIFFLNIVPRSSALFIGSLLGFVAYLLLRKDRHKAFRHLSLAFGDKLSRSESKSIARRLFLNIGRNAVDVIRLRKHYDEVSPLVMIEGREHFEQAYRRGKGIIAITGHLGNFELLAIHLANSGYKVAAIARELYDKRLDLLLRTNREALKVMMVDTRQSPRRVVRLLSQGYAIGVLIDTDSMRVRSIFVPAFGRLSNTPVGQSVLGLRTGAAFIPMTCVRQGKKYRLIIRPEIVIERSDNLEKDVYNMTRKCTEALEVFITEFKDQWIWMHNRWLTRPEKPIDKEYESI